MDCERYEAILIDAVLGTLEPQYEAELRAHLAGCSVCRAALDAERRLHAAIDDGISASVAPEPSPDFAARVRQRIEQKTLRPRPWFAEWKAATAGALAFLALMTVWFARHETPGSGTRRSSQATVATQQQAPNTGTATEQRTVLPRPGVQRGHGGAERAHLKSARQGPRRGPALPAQSQVVVAPEERVAVLRLYNALRSGRVDAASLLAERAALGSEELRIAPLKVAAIDLEWKEPPSERAR